MRTLSRLAEVSVRDWTAALAEVSVSVAVSACASAWAASGWASASTTRVTAVKPLVPKSTPSTSAGAATARAGLSKTTFYNLALDKEALLRRIVADVTHRAEAFAQAVPGVFDGCGSAAELGERLGAVGAQANFPAPRFQLHPSPLPVTAGRG